MTRQMEQAIQKLKQIERTDYTNVNRLRDDMVSLFKKVLDVMDLSPDPRLSLGWRDPHDAR